MTVRCGALVAIVLAGAVLVNAVLLRGTLQAATPAQSADATRSVWSGVYTEEQAERGHITYLQSCSVCHRDDLKGDSAEEVPGLATEQFLDGWNGRTVKDLVETIRRTMPGDRPGSLPPNAYVDLVAFILKSNTVPSGRQPLANDTALLEPLLIERAPR